MGHVTWKLGLTAREPCGALTLRGRAREPARTGQKKTNGPQVRGLTARGPGALTARAPGALTACEPGARNRPVADCRAQVWGMPARDPSRDSDIRNSQYARYDAIELSLSRADSAKQTLGRLPSGRPAAGLRAEEAPTLHAATKGF